MKKSDVVHAIFHGNIPQKPIREKGLAFAPTNIALCKYWGKRDTELNLPVTSSLSVTLPDKGTMTSMMLHDQPCDRVIVNSQELSAESTFVKRLVEFLDLFRPAKTWYLQIDIDINIPVAAGLASSASGFASLILALNNIFEWQLTNRDLSILARLGSGSASRSFWLGFVEWYAGVQPDGMDCFAEPLSVEWPQLCVGLLTLDTSEKAISSRKAMQHTVNSSVLYSCWPRKVSQDLAIIKQALKVKNFPLLGGTSESNALSMHATMLSSWPSICYFLPETIAAMHKIWALRRDNLELYFTQDAGPNLKLLFLEKDQDIVKTHFPQAERVKLFES
ncbi:MAG: diphosphomevalonate decarboxylase [Gammaproteobacteria bacterium RIFCSPHIGHO2_12_FULL_37_14]|nr:MAG: diphosphomevalonate decarboxylase [Gammaproteobacteria bacterium RIFCSPHIGHO2_12_FULL_37_14]